VAGRRRARRADRPRVPHAPARRNPSRAPARRDRSPARARGAACAHRRERARLCADAARRARGCSAAAAVRGDQASLLALLADGAAWSTSALALALGASQRTVQRALVELEDAGRVRSIGRTRAQRWLAPSLAGFTTILLLPLRCRSRRFGSWRRTEARPNPGARR
jgi:hypothetical protein